MRRPTNSFSTNFSCEKTRSTAQLETWIRTINLKTTEKAGNWLSLTTIDFQNSHIGVAFSPRNNDMLKDTSKYVSLTSDAIKIVLHFNGCGVSWFQSWFLIGTGPKVGSSLAANTHLVGSACGAAGIHVSTGLWKKISKIRRKNSMHPITCSICIEFNPFNK